MKHAKQLLIICCFAFLQTTLHAQAKKTTNKRKVAKKESVILINTNNRSVVVMKNFLTPAITASILKQISVKQFNDFNMHSNQDDYPLCIKDKLGYDSFVTDVDPSDSILKSLKLYRIAKFKNIQHGKDFGESSILVAPAKENKNVGGDCNYEIDFYIIIPTKDIEIIK